VSSQQRQGQQIQGQPQQQGQYRQIGAQQPGAIAGMEAMQPFVQQANDVAQRMNALGQAFQQGQLNPLAQWLMAMGLLQPTQQGSQSQLGAAQTGQTQFGQPQSVPVGQLSGQLQQPIGQWGQDA
jgi:hypothetical protein